MAKGKRTAAQNRSIKGKERIKKSTPAKERQGRRRFTTDIGDGPF